MASTTVTVKFVVRWTETEPDGSKCCYCGDSCLLRMWHLVLSIAGREQWSAVGGHCMCQSCAEMTEDRYGVDEVWG